MVDLHCHILPALDDGALDLRDSAGMARQAAADGIEAICATPHIRHDHDVRVHELADRVEAVNERLREEGVPVAVLRGGEVAETAVEGLSEEELEHGGAGRTGAGCCWSRRQAHSATASPAASSSSPSAATGR